MKRCSLKIINSVILMFFVILNISGKELPQKPLLINCDMSAYKLRHGNAATGQIIEVTGMPFKKMWRISIKKKLDKAYDIQLKAPLLEGLSLGDKGFISIYVRAVETIKSIQRGKMDVLMEKNSKPWTKFLYATFYPTTKWQRIDIPFEVKASWKTKHIKNYPANTVNLSFNLNKGIQVLEIAVVDGRNFGPHIDLKRLPRTPQGYPGDELNAPWRKAALKRIEKIRKGNFNIQVVDRFGKPIPNAEVKVEMQKHQFSFGACINIYAWGKSKTYRENFFKLYNTAVFETGMKWKRWPEKKTRVNACLKELKKNNVAVRGHCLIWPSWGKMPKSIKKLKDNKEKLIKTVDEHIYKMAYAMRNETFEWDVVNESFTNHDLMDIYGNKIMINWFKIAKKAAPGNAMYINDYNILTCGENLKHPQIVNYKKIIKYLLDNKAPLEGIGIQSHFKGGVTAPGDVLKTLDFFAEFKLPIKITEYDINTNDEQLAAKYMRDFMTATFSHSAVNGFLMWGFWDGCHWKNNAPVFNKDWSFKPSGKMYKKLVFGDWWTNLKGRTNYKGVYAGRGFLGDYIIKIKTKNNNITRKVKLGKQGLKTKIIIN